MSGFASAAKSLISQAAPPHQKTNQPQVLQAVNRESAVERLDHIRLLSKNGFSPDEVLRDLRELYDACEPDEKSIRLQISKLMIQVLGMLAGTEEVKAAPSFTFVIQGDNNRINTMLCPLAQ